MGNVEYQFGDSIRDVSRKEDGSYEVSVGGRTVTSASVVIATGGPSIPKMGATAYAYDLARQFGLKVVEPRPALVPLTLGGDETLFRELSGVATEVVARSGKTEFREAALFTHKGLSGPAILQVSSYWRKGEEIGINFLPDKEKGWLLEAKRTNSAQAFKTVIGNLLPARLAETLVERIGFSHELNNISDKKLVDAEQRLANWRFTPNGSEGLAKAEVTAGGISTDGLSSQTMEAKKMPGLYAIGEAVDVTGWLGGYNFQWAWASAWAAGQVL
jgi:predicted Rossmann fold flavoprotein